MHIFPIWRRTSPSVSRLALPTLARPAVSLSVAHRPRLHTPITAASDQSSAEVSLPCPDWPYLPSLVLRSPYQSPTDLAWAHL